MGGGWGEAVIRDMKIYLFIDFILVMVSFHGFVAYFCPFFSRATTFGDFLFAILYISAFEKRDLL